MYGPKIPKEVAAEAHRFRRDFPTPPRAGLPHWPGRNLTSLHSTPPRSDSEPSVHRLPYSKEVQKPHERVGFLAQCPALDLATLRGRGIKLRSGVNLRARAQRSIATDE